MTPDEYLGRVRALLPALRERAARAEQLRRLPDETFADFQEAGLFRAHAAEALWRLRARPRHLLPGRHRGRRGVRLERLDLRRRGRPQLAPRALSAAGAGGCLGRGRQRPAVDLAGADRHGRAGRRRLSPLAAAGRFRAAAISANGSCSAASRRRRSRARRPTRAYFWCRAPTTRSTTTGTSSGLCGTGSKDIVVDDAFVPEYRTHSYLDAFHLRNPGTAVNDAPLYRLPFGARLLRYGIAAPAIGVALGALDAFREQSQPAHQPARPLARRRGPVHAVPPRRVRRRDRRGARPDARQFRRDDATRPRRRGDPAGAAGALSLGCRQGDRLERAAPSTACSRRAAATASFSTTRSSAPGATCTRCGRMPATTRSAPPLVFARSEFGLPPQDIRF